MKICGNSRGVPGHFLTVTTGAFTPVDPLLAPVVKQCFQMSWALLIMNEKVFLLKKLHLPALILISSLALTFSTFESQHSIDNDVRVTV